jgi:hypothetical protein
MFSLTTRKNISFYVSVEHYPTSQKRKYKVGQSRYTMYSIVLLDNYFWPTLYIELTGRNEIFIFSS